jgi:DNA-binding IclR family transcriptional regulator
MAAPVVKVLRKAAAILGVLAAEPDLTPAEVAAATGEPRPTIYRLLQDLAVLGYVEEGQRSGSYRLGLELFHLGSSVGLRLDVRDAAAPVMSELHKSLEETVYLVVRRGREAVCIERIEGLRIRSMALQLGGSLPLHLGAGPRVLLAYEGRDVWDEYLEGADTRALTARTPTNRTAILSLLEEVRSLGYAVSDEDVTLGITSVGAPVFDHTGAVCAALSIGGLRSAVLGEDDGRRAVELVTQGAAEVSRRMGSLGTAARPSDEVAKP